MDTVTADPTATAPNDAPNAPAYSPSPIAARMISPLGGDSGSGEGSSTMAGF